MPSLTATVFFLGLPIFSCALSALVVFGGLSDLKRQGPLSDPSAARGRVLVLWSASSTVPIYGLVLWLLVSGKEHGSVLTARDAGLIDWTAIVYGWLAGVTLAAQSLTVRARMAQLLGPAFGRVLIFITASLVPIIFALVVDVQILGRIPLSPSVSESRVNSTIMAFMLWALVSPALPTSAAVAARIQDLASPQGFIRAIRLSNFGMFPSVVAFAWTLLQVYSL